MPDGERKNRYAVLRGLVGEDYLVPAEQWLPVEWLRSLQEKAGPRVYRGMELNLIGMPVGGTWSSCDTKISRQCRPAPKKAISHS